ncbi:cob(I)alamin adenosyltransferase [Palleronia marisminoris]|uniref:Corrinoid adenosyltransferase n=1 Tax=Palleronia marisminoris TaxID=315423 RepID=A0A1Y5TWZ0_9RHOB|nr:cob(I)yrinic acid a,c-diamide adenosyltransferase [Palleronia marisminoris]SFH54213.1 cob(I)alamin adenosyltransferase [Palleronia marisminoris]SLN72040.1 Cob(I)yrinic acid a,c-diamide adenosyltransferase [Palleronia marisminoris]
MVVLSKIYTRTGDEGETALGNGTRVAKFDARVESYGTVDEANAFFGMARLHAKDDLAQQIERIQNDLFDLGADLCNPDLERDDEAEHPPLRMVASQTERLEAEIDAMNERLETLRSFVLPGGSALSAHLHICRTVVRRAERLCIELAAAQSVNSHAITYLNRLSDWCFCAARLANDDGRADVLWTPGANR